MKWLLEKVWGNSFPDQILNLRPELLLVLRMPLKEEEHEKQTYCICRHRDERET